MARWRLGSISGVLRIDPQQVINCELVDEKYIRGIENRSPADLCCCEPEGEVYQGY